MALQLVQVRFDTGDQLYTYGWWISDVLERTPLEVGERVVAPANWRNDTESVVTVAALGSDWPGPVRYLVRRESDDAAVPGEG